MVLLRICTKVLYAALDTPRTKQQRLSWSIDRGFMSDRIYSAQVPCHSMPLQYDRTCWTSYNRSLNSPPSISPAFLFAWCNCWATTSRASCPITPLAGDVRVPEKEVQQQQTARRLYEIHCCIKAATPPFTGGGAATVLRKDTGTVHTVPVG